MVQDLTLESSRNSADKNERTFTWREMAGHASSTDTFKRQTNPVC
jgi:hypothetical protein